MKNCKRCFDLKPISEYYKHKAMPDGHLNICKDCVKAFVFKRTEALKLNREWVEQERERCRIKSRARNAPVDLDKKKEYMKTYLEKYPEKKAAATMAQHIKCEVGYQRHHWSYQSCDGKSVFFLKIKDHALVHRFLIYDKATMKYKTANGKLLDTKEKHAEYIDQILKNHTY